MANLKYGSAGDDVEKLQNALIEAGYDVGSTGADGVFGKNTLAAVKAYQEANGLAVDGIAGKNTQGLLYGTNTSTTNTTTNTTPTTNTAPVTNTTASGYTYEAFAPSENLTDLDTKRQEIADQKPGEFTYDPYAESEIVTQANAILQQHINDKPGEYTSVWQDEADAYLSQYQNRDPFSYDFNSDALYNQYKNQYIQQGKLAMMDTMGQAAAMTGGYGNSYAQTAGQQAYNQQLNQLNDIMPELYQIAYDRYNQEGQDLLNMYSIYMDKENQEYSRYQDNLNNWYTQLDYLTEDARYKAEDDYSKWYDKVGMDYDIHRDSVSDWQYDLGRADDEYWNQYGQEYGEWSDNTNMAYDDYWNNINMEYQKDRDAVEDAQWQKTFDYNTTVDQDDGNNNTAGKETTASYEEIQSIIKEFERCVDADALNLLSKDLIRRGYSEEWVKDYVSYYDNILNPNDGGYTDVDPTSFEGVKASILQMANSECKWLEIDAELNKAVKNRYITEAERKEIRSEAATTRQNYANGKLTK